MKSKIATGIVLFSVLAALSLGVVFAENNATAVGEDMNKTNMTNMTNLTNMTSMANATANATNDSTAE